MRTVLVLLALVVATGCPSGGPCSSPASLFPSPSARGTRTDAGVQVDVSWGVTSAPPAFYASPTVRGDVLLIDAGVTGAQVSSTSQRVGTLEFDLRYVEGPTRTCQHVGMDDTFILSVSVPVLADGGVGAGMVDTSLDLGAL